MATIQKNEHDMLSGIILDAIKREIKERTSVAVEEAAKSLRADIETIAAAVSVNILKHVTFDRMGQEFVIRVKSELGE